MANIVSLLFIMGMAMTCFEIGVGNAALTMNYYKFSCPLVDSVVKKNVQRALNDDPTLAAGLVRMHFHDCFIQGCDGSVLIDSTADNAAEKDSVPNLSLRGFEIIDTIKEDLENICPGVVSCADLLAMAAREAISFVGGPKYHIPNGRKDARRSRLEDTFNLPSPALNASHLIRNFRKQGFSANEMVTLSGAHTLGVAQCVFFKQRLIKKDPTLDSQLAKTLSETCRLGDNAEHPLDASEMYFDNSYFKSLTSNRGVLTSDQTLYTSPKTKNIVQNYAINQTLFFSEFKQAMIKMSLLNVKEGSEGEVRKNCRKIN